MATQQAVSGQLNLATKPFDRTTLRVNQAFIITFLVVGFLLNQPVFVVFIAAVMAIGTAFPQAALFQRLYRDVLRPAKLLQPDLHAEDPAPHRFAQGMGAGVLILALIGFIVGALSLGWALTIVVIVLAAVNLVFGFCAGCFVYFQLQRFGLIGK
jgi:uncharacterized membrane protein YhaH (DUF805 family)